MMASLSEQTDRWQPSGGTLALEPPGWSFFSASLEDILCPLSLSVL